MNTESMKNNKQYIYRNMTCCTSCDGLILCFMNRNHCPCFCWFVKSSREHFLVFAWQCKDCVREYVYRFEEWTLRAFKRSSMNLRQYHCGYRMTCEQMNRWNQSACSSSEQDSWSKYHNSLTCEPMKSFGAMMNMMKWATKGFQRVSKCVGWYKFFFRYYR